MIELFFMIAFVWLTFKTIQNIAEELGRYLRGFCKWVWKTYKKHVNKGVGL